MDREAQLEELICEMYAYVVYMSLVMKDPMGLDERLTEEQSELLTQVFHNYQPPKEKSVTIPMN